MATFSVYGLTKLTSHSANRISRAAYNVIGDGKTRTRDMGGTATTHEFTRALLDKMEAAL